MMQHKHAWFAALWFALASLLASSGAVQAQVLRRIPPGTYKGELQLVGDGVAQLGEHYYRLSPAAQIRSTGNTLILPVALRGRYPARVRFDQAGQIHRVWLLTAAEAEAAEDDFKTGSEQEDETEQETTEDASSSGSTQATVR